ncbi:IS3 family transposase [Micromonospora sp. LZ34]
MAAAVKGTYGAPRVHAELSDARLRHSRKRVARLMRAAGIRGKSPRRWRATTIPDPAAMLRPDLIRRDFITTRLRSTPPGAATVGLTRFDGHLGSGAGGRATGGCPASWRAWVGSGLGLVGRSRRDSTCQALAV